MLWSSKKRKILCPLCGKAAEPAKSHILSKSLYNKMIDERGVRRQYIAISTDKKIPIREDGGGEKERLLCIDCDNYLGTYEDYYGRFRDDRVGEALKPSYSNGILSSVVIDKINYTKLKLFILSNLWRCSITEHPEFQNFHLGDFHEEKIRELIISGSPGDKNDYPIIGYFFYDIGNDFIRTPENIEYKNILFCRMVFGKYVWVVFLSDDLSLQAYDQYCLHENGSFTMTVTSFKKTGMAEEFIRLLNNQITV